MLTASGKAVPVLRQKMSRVLKVTAVRGVSIARKRYCGDCTRTFKSNRKYFVLAKKQNVTRNTVPALQPGSCVVTNVRARVVSTVLDTQITEWTSKKRRKTPLLLNNWRQCKCLIKCSLIHSTTISFKADFLWFLLFIFYVLNQLMIYWVSYVLIRFDKIRCPRRWKRERRRRRCRRCRKRSTSRDSTASGRSTPQRHPVESNWLTGSSSSSSESSECSSFTDLW